MTFEDRQESGLFVSMSMDSPQRVSTFDAPAVSIILAL